MGACFAAFFMEPPPFLDIADVATAFFGGGEALRRGPVDVFAAVQFPPLQPLVNLAKFRLEAHGKNRNEARTWNKSPGLKWPVSCVRTSSLAAETLICGAGE